ncbi:MAG: RiPP maturation radical SAM C-methyltransferase, partial [Acetobacteraceae bacterium]|nr:RiPP maturation radical SAM C-methyltransferase [Acetobacteraceae bacterium]
FRAQCPEGEFVSRLLLILEAREGAAAFIDKCVDQVPWDQYAVLGLSTSFQQNMASLAFAKRVKARFPHVFVVFGGANCQGEMGIELHRRYGFIDAVCLSEGDEVFPELVQRHLADLNTDGLPGIVGRAPDGSSVLPAVEVRQIEDLDRLPYPDLSDFYEQRRALSVASQSPPAVMFETARGCWWGAKHHCTFCGINGRMMAYRSKSQTRAYEELAHLVTSYGSDVVNADAILDMRYFQEFLPRLASEGPRLRMFWQMKANLRPEQFALLARAGITRIQPGIEALDTELLTLMKKGCTMLQNVQTLKLAAEYGLSVAWNLLYGFPDETAEAYRRSAEVIPKLRHLQPPLGVGRVYADRFSPYFQRPESFGVRLKPVPAYGFVYPFDEDTISRLAYHFEMHSEALYRIEETVAPMLAEQRLWTRRHLDSVLYCEDLGEVMTVTDRRWGWERRGLIFTGAEAELLRLCWRNTAWNRIRSELGGRFSDTALESGIARLLGLGLVLHEGAEFLALPLRQPGWQRAPTMAEIAEARGWTVPEPDRSQQIDAD